MPTEPATIYRLKITLQGIRPPIWRKLEVPDCNLEELHFLIQTVMPWDNYHLWEFETPLGRFSLQAEEAGLGMFDDDEAEAPDEMTLGQLAAAGAKTITYTYDMGDGWEHRILLERSIPAKEGVVYPQVIKGERACPPEDCGGVWGYAELLEILGDPKHEEREERLEWLGGDIDPEAFDLKAANRGAQKTWAALREPGKKAGKPRKKKGK